MEKNKDKRNTKIERVEGICLKRYIIQLREINNKGNNVTQLRIRRVTDNNEVEETCQK